MKIGFIAPLVLPALGRFALASENDSNSGKSLRGSDGGGLFGGAAGEVSIVYCCTSTVLHMSVNVLQHCFLILYSSPYKL
jgi:hypothetical protein